MGGAAGFVRTSLAVVTFLGKSSPSPLRPGGFHGRAERGCRRCQAGHRSGHATYLLRCSPGTRVSMTHLSMTHLSMLCSCSPAEAQFSQAVYAARGRVCYAQLPFVPLKNEHRNS